MPARTPVPVQMVAAPVRAIRGGGRGRADKGAPPPSRELVAIQQLTREVAVLRGETVEDDLRGARDGGLPAWMYRQRKPLAAIYVGLVLAGAKVLMLGPAFLPAIGLAVVVILTIAAVAWARRCGTIAPKVLLEQIPSEYRWRVAPLLTPRAAAVMSATCAAVWWARPATLKEASWTWVVAVIVGIATRAYRFRIRPAAPVTEPAVGPADIYRMHVAEQVSEAGRTYVDRVHDVTNPKGERIGFALDVAVPPPSKGASVVAPQVVGYVKTAFGVGVQDVMTLVPRTAAEGGERRFTVTVLDRPGANALEQVHPYEGASFDPEAGTWVHAVRADWTPAVGQLYDRVKGSRSIHLSGETGGGKSESNELILRNVTSAGLVIPAIVDIDGSMVDWAEVALVYVTTPEHAAQLLVNYSDLIQHRKDKKKAMRQYDEAGRDLGPCRVYPVDEEHPVWLLDFDEWQFEINRPVTGPIILGKTEEVVTQQRKVMCPMLAAGQATGLVQGFKNNTTVRTQFQGGTMIAHRNNTDSGRQAFGGNIQVDPSKIPLGLAGALYMTSPADARDAMARAQWVQQPRLFDHARRIPEAPGDELDILLRGLPGGARLDRTVIDVKPTPAVLLAASEPAVTMGRPNLTVVPASASDSLKRAMKAWAREQERPVRRGEFVKEFAETRLVASRNKVDTALREMKEAGEFDADADGYYTLKEAA